MRNQLKSNKFLESLGYEEFVKMSYEALISEHVGCVYLRKPYIGKRTGHQHEIDVSIELTVADLRIIVLVECKHYRNKVEVSDVLEFAQRLDDIGAHKGVMVTTIGFQGGATRVAEAQGIALVTTVPRWQMVMYHSSDGGFSTAERTPTGKEKTAKKVARPHDTIARIHSFDIHPRQEYGFSEAWKRFINSLSDQVVDDLFESGILRVEPECPSCGSILQAVDFRQCPRCFFGVEESNFGDSAWFKCTCQKMIHVSDLNAVRCQCGKVLSNVSVDRMCRAELAQRVQASRSLSIGTERSVEPAD